MDDIIARLAGKELYQAAIDAAAKAAEETAELENVGEYGYGGEVFPHHVVTNWGAVVEAALDAYFATIPKI